VEEASSVEAPLMSVGASVAAVSGGEGMWTWRTGAPRRFYAHQGRGGGVGEGMAPEIGGTTRPW
jgi:hypothetical protein